MIIKSDEEYWQYVWLVDDMLMITGGDEDHYLNSSLDLLSEAIMEYDQKNDIHCVEPIRRVKGRSKTSSLDIQQAAEAGDKVFQYFCEHGRLPPEVVK